MKLEDPLPSPPQIMLPAVDISMSSHMDLENARLTTCQISQTKFAQFKLFKNQCTVEVLKVLHRELTNDCFP